MPVELKDGFKCSYYAVQYTDHCTANIHADFFTVQCSELKLKHVWLKLVTAVQKGHFYIDTIKRYVSLSNS